MNTLDKVYDLTIDIKNIDVKYNSYAKFFDDDRETSVIRIKLLNDKTPMNLENCIVEAYFILADNTYHNEACKIINSSEGVVELQLCQKCLVKGENIVRLSILKDNEISNTPVITYEVRKGLYSDNPSFNDDPLTPILSQMLLDIKVTKVNQIELQERYEKTLPKIEGKIEEVDNAIDRVNNAIASGTQDLEVKEARVDKNGKSYSKLGDRLDAVDSQLEHIANNTIFIKNDIEDLGEFINNISGDFNKIVLLGEYNIYSPVIFSEKNNLIITGKCKINICKDLDCLFTFDKCSNLLIDGLEIDGNNKECYKVINLIECENSKVENCNIKNIKNLDVNKQSSIIKVLSNNFNISNIKFKNIKSYAIQENEGSGKGSLQCIYVLIHEDYRKGKIENVNAYNISNIDENNMDIVIDVDVILSQYSNDGIDANPVDSMLLIENIYGYDYGKRIVKLQTSGVNVEKIKGKYENINDGYSLISIHNTDVNVKNAELVTINNDGCSCFIDAGLLAKNINIQNIKFSGKCRTGVIQIGNGSRLNASDNIIIDNFICNATARELISIQHTVTNIIFKNFSVIGKFNADMIKINSYTLTSKVEYKLIDSKIDVVCPTLFQYTTGGDLGNVDFINSSIKIDMMGESGNVFGLRVLDGELNVKNTNIVVNNASYMWGLFVCDSNKINIENSCITLPTQKSSDCVIARLFGNNVSIYNFTTDNKRMTIRGFNTSINKCINCNRIQLEKLDGISEQHNVSILNYSNEVYTNNNSDYNFINSDTFVLSTSVKLTNGHYSGTLTLPYRMTSLKVLNCYSENLDVVALAYKGSGTSYNNIDIKCKHNDLKFNDSINLFIIYQR